MGALLGMLLGIGLLLIWQACALPPPRQPDDTTRQSLGTRLDELIAAAGVEGMSARTLVAVSVAAGVLVGLLGLGISGTAPIAVIAGVFAGYGPLALVRYRARQRRQELSEVWPDAVDNLASGIRAGLSLPEALIQLSTRGPVALRRPFARFGEDYRATGRFDACLDLLKVRLADPTGDRLVESLRVARDVGGSDLGRLLRTLSTFLREDARTRAELETRQGWTVNAARLAVAAPWVLLGLMAMRTSSVQAYNTPTGWVILGAGALLCVLAYRLMLRLGRLPTEVRVLR